MFSSSANTVLKAVQKYFKVTCVDFLVPVDFCLSITYITPAILTHLLRLLQTFAGVLQKKIRARAVFKKTPTNYISTERL